MKNKIALLLALFLFMSAFYGCGEEKNITIDTAVLSEKLSEHFGMGEIELLELSEESVNTRYGIDGLYSYVYAEASVTISSDEFLVLKANDAESAKKVYDLLNAYREERIELFASYAANEVPKIEGALLERAGEYIVFAVAADISEAKKIWNEQKG